MKANHVPAHSDFMTEMTLIKIACAGTLGLIPCCLIGTRSNVSYVCMYIYYVTVTKKRNKCKAWKIAKLQTKQEWQTSKHLSFALLPKSIRPQKRWQGPRRNSTAASQGAKPQLVDSLPVTYQRVANKFSFNRRLNPSSSATVLMFTGSLFHIDEHWYSTHK